MNLDQCNTEALRVISHLDDQFKTLRTGRAHAGLIEGLMVEAYGGTMDLKSTASITVLDARTLLVDPWDKTLVTAIEKAIREAPVGLNPQSDGKVLRVPVPQPTEESRREMVKVMKNMAEDARIALRRARDEAKTSVIASEEAGEIGEDQRFRIQDQLDVMIKKYNALIEEKVAAKEQDIMTI